MDDPRPRTHALARVLARSRRPAVVSPTPAPFDVVEAPPTAAPPTPDARTLPAPHLVRSAPSEPGTANPLEAPPAPPLGPTGGARSGREEPAQHPSARRDGPGGGGPTDPPFVPEVEVILDPPPSAREEPARPSAAERPTSPGRNIGAAPSGMWSAPVAHDSVGVGDGDRPAGGSPAGPLTVSPGTPPDQLPERPPARSGPDAGHPSRRTPTDAGPRRPEAPSPEPPATPPTIVIERIDISSPPPAGPAADPLASLATRRRGRSRQPTSPAR